MRDNKIKTLCTKLTILNYKQYFIKCLMFLPSNSLLFILLYVFFSQDEFQNFLKSIIDTSEPSAHQLDKRFRKYKKVIRLIVLNEFVYTP